MSIPRSVKELSKLSHRVDESRRNAIGIQSTQPLIARERC